jgi:hypothetical protein
MKNSKESVQLPQTCDREEKVVMNPKRERAKSKVVEETKSCVEIRAKRLW